MTFGHKLKRYREENGLTQQVLADLVGTNKQTIWRFENSHITPRLDTVRLYAETLNLPFDYLVNDNIVTESGLDLSNKATRSALWRYIDADEFGTPILVFNGLCNAENIREANKYEEERNKEYLALCEELRKNPLGRDEVKIIVQLRKQPELRIAIMRMLGIAE